MIDVAAKEITARVAVARATLECLPQTLQMIRDGSLPKGDPLGVARVAAIQAAKKTSDLVPLCHPLHLTSVDVDFAFPSDRSVAVTVTVRAVDRTGVEMEALTAAAVAALSIYDMSKAVERGMTIREIALLEKRGGKSGTWLRAETKR
ncbi:MAG: cyclic pyranopterin monophosphate synthase MoaC [Planctomycetes bacterium]|nr:cyclic pyranopterin monophosphate synthase MoaC [Planctomycetota bacterium]MBI3845827.1 cyclic pyranopterin monophosphate synthase MoaC [Planctomycetota bacterium]